MYIAHETQVNFTEMIMIISISTTWNARFSNKIKKYTDRVVNKPKYFKDLKYIYVYLTKLCVQ